MSGHPNPKAQPPQITIAFGVFYFLVQAVAKFYLAGSGREKQRAATLTMVSRLGELSSAKEAGARPYIDIRALIRPDPDDPSAAALPDRNTHPLMSNL